MRITREVIGRVLDVTYDWSVQTKAAHFGQELRRWRNLRRLTQLELALDAEVSQKHISFLENGRSKPSPEMVEHLAVHLDVPLRSRNAMLQTAGFAPLYPESSMNAPELDAIRDGLAQLVEAHNPFPAYVIDRGWNIVLANDAAIGFAQHLLGSTSNPHVQSNAIRLILHPDGAADRLVNAEQTTAVLVERLTRECTERPHDQVIAALLEEIQSYPLVQAAHRRDGYASTTVPAGVVEFEVANITERYFTTIAAMATAGDLTVDELRLETLLPADASTRAVLAGRTE